MKLGAENDWYTLVFRVKSREEYLNCWRCVALNATSFIHVVHRRIMTKMKRCRGDRGWTGKMRKGKKAKVTKTSKSREILSRISILFAKRYNKIPGERAISKFVGSSLVNFPIKIQFKMHDSLHDFSSLSNCFINFLSLTILGLG